MARYKSLIVIPIIIIILSVYLIGANILNRIDVYNEERATQAVMAEDNMQRTEAEEDAELDIIGDRININTATESELKLLDGIGDTIAKRIIKKRDELGGFTSIEQITEVEGIGAKLYEKIQDYIMVE